MEETEKTSDIKEPNNIRKQSLRKMDETNSQEQSSPEKLQIDDPNNFQFHAAYLVYAELFDNMNEEEVKRELNKNIEALVKREITCQVFYSNVARYRGESQVRRKDRASFKTQRKRDWRAKSQKQERIKRHRK